MIRLAIAAALALFAASPAYAADTCATPADAKVATSTDTAALNKGVACRAARIKGRESTIVGLQAANKVDADQVAARVARLAQLAKPPVSTQPPATTVPKPVPPSGVIPAAIPSNFDRTAFISGGLSLPQSAAPDVLGAFRLICQPSHRAYDDPIVWPGQPGKSELHEFFGNTKADAYSTFASLRTSGESTCMNVLNRSAYWYPALLDAKGNVIRADFISLYYKRFPASSPLCKERAKACVNLPNGLRLKQMVEHFRCQSGPVYDHRATFAEALKDCGGSGQVMAVVNFGSCWNGKTDSLDHSSHVTHYVGKADAPWILVCPAGYDQIIPELSQGVVWTVTPADGAVRFSMPMFHADYITAWDQPTLDTFEANCIDKLLNCSDGDLGNGTIMKRWAGFGYTANPRVVPAPAGGAMAGMVH